MNRRKNIKLFHISESDGDKFQRNMGRLSLIPFLFFLCIIITLASVAILFFFSQDTLSLLSDRTQTDEAVESITTNKVQINPNTQQVDTNTSKPEEEGLSILEAYDTKEIGGKTFLLSQGCKSTLACQLWEKEENTNISRLRSSTLRIMYPEYTIKFARKQDSEGQILLFIEKPNSEISSVVGLDIISYQEISETTLVFRSQSYLEYAR